MTTGCTEALAAAMLGLVEPGDEVVVIEPFYDAYPADLALAGAVPRFVTLRRTSIRVWTPMSWRRRSHPGPGPSWSTRRTTQPVGYYRRRAGRHRPAVRRARRHRHHRRGLRGDGVRAPPLAAGRTRRDVGAHPHTVLAGQDLLAHRVEGGVGDRAGGAHRGGQGGTPISHLHHPDTGAARRGRRPRRSRLVLRRDEGRATGQNGTSWPQGWPTPGSRSTPPRAPTSRWRGTGRCPRTDDRTVLPAAWWSGRVWSPFPPSVFYHDPADGSGLVRFAFCKDEATLTEAIERLGKLSNG